MNDAISVPGLPFLRIHNSSPSVLTACQTLSVKLRGSFPTRPGISPNPLPSRPWQVTQKAFPWKSAFPFWIFSSEAGKGFVQVRASSIIPIGTRGLRTASSAPKAGTSQHASADAIHRASPIRHGMDIVPPLPPSPRVSPATQEQKEGPTASTTQGRPQSVDYLSECPGNLCPRDCGNDTVPSGNSCPACHK